MNREAFLAYLELYNSGSWDAVCQWYTEDIVFESFGNRMAGPAVREFLSQLHRGMRDHMTVRTLLIDDTHAALEADARIEALSDLPHLPAGPMRKGDVVMTRMFVFYDIVGDRFSHIRVAGWPPAPIKT
jgi:hypothetical protein